MATPSRPLTTQLQSAVAQFAQAFDLEQLEKAKLFSALDKFSLLAKEQATPDQKAAFVGIHSVFNSFKHLLIATASERPRQESDSNAPSLASRETEALHIPPKSPENICEDSYTAIFNPSDEPTPEARAAASPSRNLTVTTRNSLASTEGSIETPRILEPSKEHDDELYFLRKPSKRIHHLSF